MSEIGVQNPFAPPRALVEDQFAPQVEMVLASRRARLLACFIDASPGLVVGILAAIALFAVPGLLQGVRPAPGSSAVSALVVAGITFGLGLLAWLIVNVVSVYRYGQTIGKRVLGIRVVRTDGSRVAFSRFIFLRRLPIALLGWVIMKIGSHHPVLSYLVTLIDSLLIFRASHLCLHDNIADTKVVTAASSPEATLAGSSGAHLKTIHF